MLKRKSAKINYICLYNSKINV